MPPQEHRPLARGTITSRVLSVDGVWSCCCPGPRDSNSDSRQTCLRHTNQQPTQICVDLSLAGLETLTGNFHRALGRAVVHLHLRAFNRPVESRRTRGGNSSAGVQCGLWQLLAQVRKVGKQRYGTHVGLHCCTGNPGLMEALLWCTHPVSRHASHRRAITSHTALGGANRHAGRGERQPRRHPPPQQSQNNLYEKLQVPNSQQCSDASTIGARRGKKLRWGTHPQYTRSQSMKP